MVDNLSRALQSATMSACEGQGIVRTVQSLQSIRTDKNFDLFWQYLERRCSKVNVSTLCLSAVFMCCVYIKCNLISCVLDALTCAIINLYL